MNEARLRISNPTITIDPITGEYKLTIPEWMMNEYGWYEGLNLEWFIDIDGIHILEEEE